MLFSYNQKQKDVYSSYFYSLLYWTAQLGKINQKPKIKKSPLIQIGKEEIKLYIFSQIL